MYSHVVKDANKRFDDGNCRIVKSYTFEKKSYSHRNTKFGIQRKSKICLEARLCADT